MLEASFMAEILQSSSRMFQTLMGREEEKGSLIH